jgi:succinate dehydrogenase / fumarate reductase cytochrome b subunit
MKLTRRPVFLDLTKLRYPVGAITSILHRVAGVMLALALPLLVLALERSVADEASYQSLFQLAQSPWTLPVLALMCWALCHHLLAGLRHLLMDAGLGSSLTVARRTALAALVGGVSLALLLFVRVLS